jgi:hypothetical protein
VNWLESTVGRQLASFTLQMEGPMSGLARLCARVWHDVAALDDLLARELATIARCNVLFAVDTEGRQISATHGENGADERLRGSGRAHRPYLASAVPWQGFLLSEAFVSERTGRPSIAAVQAVAGEQGMLGFLVAQFDLRDLQLPARQPDENRVWRQIKGDPAIRQTVFMQQRVPSAMDRQSANVIAIMEELMRERGVFHGKLHFSSSRATLWMLDDPYCYRIHVLDEILDPAVCLAYPKRPYPERAVVAPADIRAVFEQFRRLREGDETIYLRAGSLNIMNGMVGLTFSCDGAHYLQAREFLDKGCDFWFGVAGSTAPREAKE